MSLRTSQRAGRLRSSFVLLPCACLVGTLCQAPSLAHAQEAIGTFSWDAPVTCPPAEQVRQRLSELQVGGPPGEERQVHVVIGEELDGSFRLSLKTSFDGREGERELLGPSCTEVTEAAIAVLALLLDAEAQEKARLEAEAEPEPEPPPPPSKPPPAPVAVEKKPLVKPTNRTPALELFISAGVGGGLGVLPGAAVFFEARAGARRGMWSSHLLGQLWPERARRSPDLSGAGAEFSLYVAGIQGCAEHSFARAGLRFCAGFEGNWLRAQGFGVDEPEAPLVFDWALAAGAGGALFISEHFRLRGLLDATLPLGRPRFVLNDIGVVYRRPWLGGRLLVGPELAF